jgi:hypothetical protein
MRDSPDTKAVLSIDGVPIQDILADKSFRQEYYTAEEFAAAIGRRVETLWRWWRAGSGPPYAWLGSRRVIPKTGAREWLRLRQVMPPRQG